MLSRLLFKLSVIACLLTISNCQSIIKNRCNIHYECSSEEKPVWATTTGSNCLVYRNGCHFLKANCERINRDEPEAIVVSKDSCQTMCGTICPPFFVPICAFHNAGHLKTFGNQCEMENHICRTGITFSVFRADKCPEELEIGQ